MYAQNMINQIVEDIKESIAPDKIYLFGSYAAGNQKETSDVDICIIKDNVKDKNQELLKINKKMYYLGVPTDILLFSEKDFSKRQDVWGSVQYEIFHKGKKMYEKRS